MWATLRWLLPSLLPAALVAYALWESDKRRDPWRPTLGTFVLGAIFAVPAFYIQVKAAAWTGIVCDKTPLSRG